MPKIALVTGVGGQDGYYLSKFLIERQGYVVHGLARYSSRVSHRLDELERYDDFFLHHGDVTDASSLARLVRDIMPHEIYNLAAQSHVAVSFEMPEVTADVNGMGPIRILEILRADPYLRGIKFYQAGTSEMFGDSPPPQNLATEFRPKSPYAISKAAAFWSVKMYREAYTLFACNGILFNHESPERGRDFVTRKITLGLVRVVLGKQTHITLGNIHAKRDWGHARDYVRAMWKILQHPVAGDYVVASGESRSVKEFVDAACDHIGIELEWQGCPLQGYDAKTGRCIVRVDPSLYRVSEVHALLGQCDCRALLDWEPEYSFDALVKDMIDADMDREKNNI